MKLLFEVIDFAMKLYARKQYKSIANGFGKSGMGIHVSCVVLKDPTNDTAGEECQSLKKCTHITFIDKTNQDAGAVLVIYQSVSKQV